MIFVFLIVYGTAGRKQCQVAHLLRLLRLVLHFANFWISPFCIAFATLCSTRTLTSIFACLELPQRLVLYTRNLYRFGWCPFSFRNGVPATTEVPECARPNSRHKWYELRSFSVLSWVTFTFWCELCVLICDVWVCAVVGGSNLSNKEWFSRQDPYVVLEYSGQKFRTRTDTG